MEPASKLPHAPSTLKPDEKAFLNEFQPLVNPLTTDKDIANGWCYEEYPCQSIVDPATAKLHSSNGIALPAITLDEVTELLDLLLKTKTVDLEPSLFEGVTSNSLMTDKIDLTLYALNLNINSSTIAGAVFDLYKINADSTSINTIRGVQVENFFVLCLKPNGVDPIAAQDFCLRRELDGAMPPKNATLGAQQQKR